jgi:small-conductance mechanosensitive channel
MIPIIIAILLQTGYILVSWNLRYNGKFVTSYVVMFTGLVLNLIFLNSCL